MLTTSRAALSICPAILAAAVWNVSDFDPGVFFDSAHFRFSWELLFLILVSTLYQPKLELSTIILGFLCQENLTKLSGILLSFGTAFASGTLVHPPTEGAGAGRIERKCLRSNNLRTPNPYGGSTPHEVVVWAWWLPLRVVILAPCLAITGNTRSRKAECVCAGVRPRQRVYGMANHRVIGADRTIPFRDWWPPVPMLGGGSGEGSGSVGGVDDDVLHSRIFLVGLLLKTFPKSTIVIGICQ